MQVSVSGASGTWTVDLPAAGRGALVVGRRPTVGPGEVAVDVASDPDGEYVSRRHLLIRLAGEQVLVTDSSSNGTRSAAGLLTRGVETVWDGAPLRLGGGTLAVALVHEARAEGPRPGQPASAAKTAPVGDVVTAHPQTGPAQAAQASPGVQALRTFVATYRHS